MAKSILIPFKTLFDDKGLKDAQKEIGKFGKGISKSFGGIVAGLGVGLGVAGIVNVFRDGAKAASEDIKSQALLAKQLQNTVDASDEQIASVEKSIAAMQLQAAVADDEIRPAFAQLTRATGDVAQATSLMQLALDVSAGTGKDLQSVTIALSKAYQGNTTGLQRMGIKVKDASTAFSELQSAYGGMAETAANNDPFARMSIIMQDVSEQIGMSLMPMLETFSKWLASEQGQKALAGIVSGFTNVGKAIGGVFEFLGNNHWVVSLVAGIGVAVAAFKALWTATKAVYAVTKVLALTEAVQAVFANAKNKVTAIASAIALVGGVGAFIAFDNMIGDFNAKVEAYKPPTFKMPEIVVPPVTTPDAKGYKASADAIAKAASDLAKKHAEAYQAILENEARIKAETTQAAQETRDAIDKMRQSFADLYAGVKPLKRVTAEVGEFEVQVVDSFKAIEDAITTSVADGTLLSDAADNLRAYAKTEKSVLLDIARQRDLITKKIDIAKSISAGVLSFGNITGMLETQTKTINESFAQMVNGVKIVTARSFEQITQGGLVENFKKVIDKTKAYAKNLIELKRLGLNGQLFKQIVDAGVEGGSDVAMAIADGGKASVDELNSLFGQLNDLGSSIAETSTDIMAQAGEDTMNAFIESLLAQDAALEATAVTLADKFAEAFRTRLIGATPMPAMPMNTSDIPLGDALNGYVADQLGRTFTGPYNYYGQQMVGGLGSNYNININAGVVTNKAELGDFLASTLKQYVRVNGSIGIS